MVNQIMQSSQKKEVMEWLFPEEGKTFTLISDRSRQIFKDEGNVEFFEKFEELSNTVQCTYYHQFVTSSRCWKQIQRNVKKVRLFTTALTKTTVRNWKTRIRIHSRQMKHRWSEQRIPNRYWLDRGQSESCVLGSSDQRRVTVFSGYSNITHIVTFHRVRILVGEVGEESEGGEEVVDRRNSAWVYGRNGVWVCSGVRLRFIGWRPLELQKSSENGQNRHFVFSSSVWIRWTLVGRTNGMFLLFPQSMTFYQMGKITY